MQKYTILITKRFKRSFKTLPQNIKQRIYEAILLLTEKPYIGTKLTGELAGLLRLRIEDYRIIYMTNEKEKQIILIDVGHRKKIYK